MVAGTMDARSRRPPQALGVPPEEGWRSAARRLVEGFGARASTRDATGDAVAENRVDMRAARLFSAGIPTELGGGGASLGELTDVIRELARGDGQTALGYAMHCHAVAVHVFRHRRGDERSTAALRTIAAGELFVAGIGGTGAPFWYGRGRRAGGAILFGVDESDLAPSPADVRHPMWNVVLPIALPLVVATYVGLAETAATLAVAAARQAGERPVMALGAMLTQVGLAGMALADMLRIVAEYDFEPTTEVADAALRRKSVAADAVKAAVDQACDIVVGYGSLPGHPIERVARDVRAMHFRPLPTHGQRPFTGRLAVRHETG